jgi:triosephosphate isomerase
MKRKKIVAGNWKMNMTLDESVNLINELKQISTNDVDIKIAPSFTNLNKAVSLLVSSEIEVIAQNVHFEERGAFTGEVSIEMLKSVGVNSVIIGHSERRKYFNENDSILSKKAKMAIDNSLNIIFCIGEELSEREKGNHFELIKNQIINGLFGLDKDQIKNVVIAYEPVWAIGTGKTAENYQIQEMHEFIRKLFNDKYGSDISQQIRILYGGSVKPNNAEEIFSLNDVDGGLIGGASLNFSDFNTIVQAANG